MNPMQDVVESLEKEAGEILEALVNGETEKAKQLTIEWKEFLAVCWKWATRAPQPEQDIETMARLHAMLKESKETA